MLHKDCGSAVIIALEKEGGKRKKKQIIKTRGIRIWSAIPCGSNSTLNVFS